MVNATVKTSDKMKYPCRKSILRACLTQPFDQVKDFSPVEATECFKQKDAGMQRDLSVQSRMSCCQGSCLSKTESRDWPCASNLSWLTEESGNKQILMVFCPVASVDRKIDWHVLLETSTSFSTLQINANYFGLIVKSLFEVDHCDRSIV